MLQIEECVVGINHFIVKHRLTEAAAQQVLDLIHLLSPSMENASTVYQLRRDLLHMEHISVYLLCSACLDTIPSGHNICLKPECIKKCGSICYLICYLSVLPFDRHLCDICEGNNVFKCLYFLNSTTKYFRLLGFASVSLCKV